MVDRRVGDGPADGNQLDPGERDVLVFGGGDPATLKEFEEMVCKDFVGPGPSSDLYPSANEEVDSTTLHHTICHPLWHRPHHCQMNNISIPPCLLCHHSVRPENTLASVVYIITCLLCVTHLHPSPTGWHCGPFGQGCVSFVIAGVLDRYLMDKNWYVYPFSMSCLLLGLVTGIESPGGIRSHCLAATSVLDMSYHILLSSRLGS